MSDDFQYDVFLSHRDKDKAVVRPLAERLRQDGLKGWLAEWGVPKADGRRQKAEGEIHPSSFILCWKRGWSTPACSCSAYRPRPSGKSSSRASGDRKSTRLNSSHLVISY